MFYQKSTIFFSTIKKYLIILNKDFCENIFLTNPVKGMIFYKINTILQNYSYLWNNFYFNKLKNILKKQETRHSFSWIYLVLVYLLVYVEKNHETFHKYNMAFTQATCILVEKLNWNWNRIRTCWWYLVGFSTLSLRLISFRLHSV